jgi:hypothetical protein
MQIRAKEREKKNKANSRDSYRPDTDDCADIGKSASRMTSLADFSDSSRPRETRRDDFDISETQRRALVS